MRCLLGGATTFEASDEGRADDRVELSEHFVSGCHDCIQGLGRSSSNFPTHVIVIAVFVVTLPMRTRHTYRSDQGQATVSPGVCHWGSVLGYVIEGTALPSDQSF